MEVEGNQTPGKTSIDAQTTGGTYQQTFFSLLFWGCGRTQKKILARSEKITDGSRYSII